MRSLLCATAVLLALCGASARPGSLEEAFSPAGAPIGAPSSGSSLTFMVSADTASFPIPTQLKLAGVSKAVTFTNGKRVGVYPIVGFANGAPDSAFVSADGTWLDQPQAILYGENASGNLTSLFVALLDVAYDQATREATFGISLVAPTPANLKYKMGPVSSAVEDSVQGIGPKISQVLPENELTGVSLIIDSSKTALKQTSDTKTFWWGWGRPYWGGGWGWGYRPWWG